MIITLLGFGKVIDIPREECYVFAQYNHLLFFSPYYDDPKTNDVFHSLRQKYEECIDSKSRVLFVYDTINHIDIQNIYTSHTYLQLPRLITRTVAIAR